MDLDLVGYLFGLLDPAERDRTEAALRSDADARARLERLRATMSPLAAARADVVPPIGLAERTLDRVAPYMRDHHPVPARRVTPPGTEPVFAPSRWRQIDVAVAACILIVVGGLGVAGAGKVQQRYDRTTCQNNMRHLHQAFVGYGAVNDGWLPRVSDRPPNNVAGAFVPILIEARQLPPHGVPTCPTVVVVAAQAPAGGYAYTLGFRRPDGNLQGLRRSPAGDTDLLPMLADRRLPAGHHSGHNVLFVGGNVRFCTTPKVGVDGDDIFVNVAEAVAAGLHPLDSVLADGNTPP
jgi:hypothetical protein